MSTSFLIIEPAFVPGPLTEAAIAAVAAEDPEGPEPAKKDSMTRRGNSLAAAILWLAVEDYRDGNRENHESARKFLYPEIPAAKEHLAGVVGMMNDLSMPAFREALDRLRPLWDAERKRRK